MLCLLNILVDNEGLFSISRLLMESQIRAIRHTNMKSKERAILRDRKESLKEIYFLIRNEKVEKVSVHTRIRGLNDLLS